MLWSYLRQSAGSHLLLVQEGRIRSGREEEKYSDRNEEGCNSHKPPPWLISILVSARWAAEERARVTEERD
jgi:hypothetical protein